MTADKKAARSRRESVDASDEESVTDEPTHPDARSGNLSDSQLNHAGNITAPITIPHDFQVVRTITLQRPTLKSALYIPNGSAPEIFFTLDSHNVQVWKGNTRIKKLPTTLAKGETVTTASNSLAAEMKLKSIIAGGTGAGGCLNINRWIWVQQHKLFIVATTRLELKCLDTNCDELSCISSIKPVLSLESVETELGVEIIAGGVGNIRVWRISKLPDPIRDRSIYVLNGPRLVIEDLGADEWVTVTLCHQASNRLYTAVDTGVFSYDYATGERKMMLRHAHDLAITNLLLVDGPNYLVTAGKDGKIKVWNSLGSLVVLCGSGIGGSDVGMGPITGLLLLSPELKNKERDKQADAPRFEPDSITADGVNSSHDDLPQNYSDHTGHTVTFGKSRKRKRLSHLSIFFLSSSLDGSLRMWHLESGRCVYRQARGAFEQMSVGLL
jgi:WD40 repeat protein